MPSESQPDEIILWNDVISLLNERDFAPSLLAMLNTCKVESFDGQRMVVSTSLGFAQRKIEEQAPAIRECLEQAAFQPVDFLVILSNEKHPAVQTVSRMTREELEQNYQGTAEAPLPEKKETSRDKAVLSARQSFFEVDNRGAAESRLTFERFVSGEENEFAFDAAKQVANGVKTSYNPLFIYGKSGVGKTHLLRAIQNYVAINDPSRLCVYRTGSEFIDDYVNAMKSDAAPARVTLLNNYKYVDILIIDDVQNMGRAAGTINFFFETYNTLLSHGKQIVLAADRSPSQLGMGDNKFDEREISRMDSGLTVSIQVPDYELKLKLINNFYERLKSEGAEDHTPGMTGTISEEDRKFMAERSGTNIRIIEGFVQLSLIHI